MANATYPPASAAATLKHTLSANPGGTTSVTIASGQSFVFANLGNIVSGWVPAASSASFPTSPNTMTYYSWLCAPGNVTVYISY